MIVNGFVGPTYSLPALTFDCQRCVNLYPIVSESGTSKSSSALASIPGYVLYATAGTGPIRGSKTMANGRPFVVSGNKLYEINANQTTTERGTLSTNTGRVSFAENGTQVMIVDGAFGYIFNMTTNAFTQITDPDFPVADVVTFQDGYFIVNVKNSPNFAISDLYDGFIWDLNDRSIASTNPDNINSLISDNGLLWIFGDRSVEVFQNTGASPFPFLRIPGAVIQTGCAATFTVQSFDNSLVWLGVDEYGRGIVWRSNGYEATRLSNQSIESIIATSSDLSESYGYVYHEQGHVFYVLQLSGINTTLVYDGATGQWHERQYKNLELNQNEQHRGTAHLFFNQNNLICDRVNGNIYRQSLSLYSYNGEYIQRERISPHQAEEKRNISFSSFELDVETGRGLSSGQGSNPQIMLQYSDDGGRTYNAERWITIGAQGKYETRVRWGRCGSARDRVWKVRYTEPTFFQINDAYINAP